MEPLKRAAHARFLGVLFAILLTISGQTAPVWVATYDASSNSLDIPDNIILGRDGSVYVSGFSDVEAAPKAAIVKYSGSGQQLWAAKNTNVTRVNLTGPLPLTALDSGGGVRLAGDWKPSTNEIALVSYSSTGTLLWERHFRDGFESHAHAVTVDGLSNTIVVGWSKSGPTADAVILKYAPDGALLWSRVYTLLPASTERAYSVATLSEGAILVGIHCDTRGLMILKYDRDGQLLWAAEPGTQNLPGAIALDSAGGIIVAGVGSSGDTLFKLSSAGELIWRKWPLPFWVNHLAVDPSGNIYVTGEATSKYDPDGTEVWTSRFAEPDSYISGPVGISATDSGVSIALGIYRMTTNRFAAVHYNTEGVEVWRESYLGAGGNVADMAGDASGGIYLTGMRDPVATGDFQTLKFQPDIAPNLPVIVTPPQSLEVIEGTNSAVFSVQTGPGEHTFQWRFYDNPIPDATNAVLSVTDPFSFRDNGSYSVIVSNVHGHVVTPDARLVVRRPPEVSSTDTNITIIAGNDLVLEIRAGGDGDFIYEWRKDGVLLAHTNSTLIDENVAASAAGTYTSLARSPYGVATNRPVVVTVVPRTPIDEWRWSRPRPQGNTLTAVAFGNGRFVAVGGLGVVLTSTNGLNWAVTNLFRFDLAGVSFGNGVFVVASRTGAIYTSPDGLTWTRRAPPRSADTWHHGVSFLNGRFVVSGLDIRSSIDGIAWIDHGFNPVIGQPVAFGAGRYLIPGYNYTMMSTNLVDWKPYVLGSDFYDLVSAAYGNGVFVINNWQELYTSPNGIDVTNRHSVPYAVNVAFVNGRFFALGETIETSVDGAAWSRVSAAFPSALFSITHGNGIYVAVGDGGIMATSTDGQIWTHSFDGISWNMLLLAYGNGRYVALSEVATWTSTDGESWIAGNPVNGTPAAIVWANGIFVVVGDDGDIHTSSDGMNWTRPTIADDNLSAVIHDGNRFVAVGRGMVLISTNGTQWHLAANEQFHTVAFGDGVYVAFVDGYSAACRVSTNAVDWEPLLDPVTATTVTYGNGSFVGVSHDRAIVSPDGRGWSSYRISEGQYFDSVTFAAGLFVASGNPHSVVATSTNGQQWVVHHTHAQVPWGKASYANGAFWIVGPDATIIRSAQIEPALRVRKTGAGFELTVQANPGRPYRLQRATALGTWTDFQTFTPQNETTTFTDNNTSQSAFYRILSP